VTRASRIAPGLRTWYGVLGAPAAWALFLVAGVEVTQTACSPAGAGAVSLDAWTIVLTVIAGAAAVGAEVAAVATFLATRDAGHELPASRVHFLSVIGIALGVLFTALIVMSGVGSLWLQECVQS